MKHWFGLNIRSNNQGLLNAVEKALLGRFDSRLWNTDQYEVYRGFDFYGVEFVTASLYFNDFNDRANFKAALGAINGFMHTTLPGSFLKMSECWHDELLENGSPVKSDEIEFEETIE